MPDEKELALEHSKQMSVFEGHRRRILYAQVEADVVKKDTKTFAIAMFSSIIDKYSITKEDAAILLECTQFI